MKRLLSISLLCIFLFNTMGYFICFKLAEQEIKAEIKAELHFNQNSSRFIALTIAKADQAKIEWMEEGEEMRYDGRMYDIAKIVETPLGTTYYCIDDNNETALNENLEKHINEHITPDVPFKKDSSKKSNGPVTKLYFTVSSAVHPDNSFSFSFFITKPIHDPARINEVNSPPPEYTFVFC